MSERPQTRTYRVDSYQLLTTRSDRRLTPPHQDIERPTTASNRDVAIKVLPEEVGQNPERLQRFKREAKALAALNHTNIATVHGFSSDGSVVFLAPSAITSLKVTQRVRRGVTHFRFPVIASY